MAEWLKEVTDSNLIQLKKKKINYEFPEFKSPSEQNVYSIQAREKLLFPKIHFFKDHTFCEMVLRPYKKVCPASVLQR